MHSCERTLSSRLSPAASRRVTLMWNVFSLSLSLIVTAAEAKDAVVPLPDTALLPATYAPHLREADACFRLAISFCHSAALYMAYADFLCERLEPPLVDKAGKI